jgi:hypothetical protein
MVLPNATNAPYVVAFYTFAAIKPVQISEFGRQLGWLPRVLSTPVQLASPVGYIGARRSTI